MIENIQRIAFMGCGLVFLWLGAGLWGSACYGQSPRQQAGTADGRVTINAEAMPLRDVIRRVEQQAGIDVVFRDALVEDVVITYACADTPWREALAALLRPTPLSFRLLDDGQVVIVRKTHTQDAPEGRVTMAGYVRDADTGEPLPYASVALKGTPFGTATNADGFFSLVQVPIGRHVLRARYVGYQPAEQAVTIGPQHGGVTIRMHPTPLQMGEVTVTDRASAAIAQGRDPGLVQLSPRRLAALPSFGETDLFRSLLLLPGIQSASDGSVSLYVRGGVPDQNLVLLDGMTIYFVDHFFGFISAFNADAIKNVRLFKGGFPAKYGGRTASVIELTGRSGSTERRQASLNLNLLSSSGMLQLPLGRRAALLFTARRSLTDVVQSGVYANIFDTVTGQQASADPRDEDGELIFNDEGYGTIRPDFSYYDVNTKLTYVSSSRDVFTMSFFNGQDDLDQLLEETFEYEDGSADDELLILDEREGTTSKWGNTGFSLKWSRVWNDRFYTNVLLAGSEYFNRLRYTYAVDTAAVSVFDFSGSEQNTITDATLRLDSEWHLSKAHKLEFGAWLTTTDVAYDYAFVQAETDTLDALNEQTAGEMTAFYFQDEWTPSRRLTVTLGVRSTYFEPLDETYLEPRVSFSYALRPRVRLKGAWGHYRQLINRVINDEALGGTRDFWLLSDEELQPSFAAHGILGASYENERYLLDLEVYRKNLDGVTEFSQRFADDPKGLLFTGEGVAQGLEVLAQRKTGQLKGWVGYTLSEVEYTFDGLNDGVPFPANQDQRRIFTAAADLKAGPWTFSASWMWASGRPYTEPESRYAFEGVDGQVYQGVRIGPKNARRLPARHRLDAGVTRRFRMGGMDLDLALSLFNVYDRQNVWYRQYRLDTQPIRVRDVMMLGFTPMVSAKVSFD